MSGNSGAWGLAMWQDGKDTTGTLQAQEQGISLSGGDAIDPWLPTEPLGYLTLPPDGLGVPGVRPGDVAFAQRDGVVQFADYYEPRILTFQVDIPNEGCPGCPSARQAVSRLTQEWSRNCTGATLVIFSDCHDPESTLDEKVYLGPYFVHGRPRAAEVTWRRSDIGGASVLLRFDAADARLVLGDTFPGTLWDSGQVQSVNADEQNLAPDADLSGLTMTVEGATVDDSFPQSGGPNGPDGGIYFRRRIISPNTTSPMSMMLSGTGTDGIPVIGGEPYTLSWWARKSLSGGPDTRGDFYWYDAAGNFLSSPAGASQAVGTEWEKFSQTRDAPASAAFLALRLAWVGTAVEDQTLDLAQAWVNQGNIAQEPRTVEVVGSLCAYPVISLIPEMTAPIVVTYGNHQFTYTEDIPLGSFIDIDTKYGRASDGFVDVTANVEGDFSSPLEPGVHWVTVQTGDPTDTGFVNFRWENAVVSG
jgi:hypothetical protein